MPSPRNLHFVCYCRNGEFASRNLLGAVSNISATGVPGAVLTMEKIEVGVDSDLDGSRRITGSPALDVIVDGELFGRFLGERTTEELRSILHELLAEREGSDG